MPAETRSIGRIGDSLLRLVSFLHETPARHLLETDVPIAIGMALPASAVAGVFYGAVGGVIV